jgi:hypothetical protein
MAKFLKMLPMPPRQRLRHGEFIKHPADVGSL